MKEITVVTSEGVAHFHGTALLDPEEGTLIITGSRGPEGTVATFNFDHVVSIFEAPIDAEEAEIEGLL